MLVASVVASGLLLLMLHKIALSHTLDIPSIMIHTLTHTQTHTSRDAPRNLEAAHFSSFSVAWRRLGKSQLMYGATCVNVQVGNGRLDDSFRSLKLAFHYMNCTVTCISVRCEYLSLYGFARRKRARQRESTHHWNTCDDKGVCVLGLGFIARCMRVAMHVTFLISQCIHNRYSHHAFNTQRTICICGYNIHVIHLRPRIRIWIFRFGIRACCRLGVFVYTHTHKYAHTLVNQNMRTITI